MAQKFHFSIDGFIFDLTLTNTQLNVVAKFGFKYQGFGSTAKGIFKINPVSDTFTSWKILDAKGHLLVSYGAFSDPKSTGAVLAAVQAAAMAPGDFAINFYPVWNHLYDGDFKVTMKGKGLHVDVGTGGLATIVGGKFADTVHVFNQKDINFNGGKGSDTLSFMPQNGPEPGVGAVIDLSAPTSVNPFGGTITLTNVENLFGTDSDDEFHGNAGNNILDGGFGGADSLYGAGGNDTLIFLGTNTVSVADGGDGIDTLQVDVTESSSVLDLTNQSNNAGVFAGGAVSDIEIFRFDEFTANATSGIEFHGSEIGETVFGGIAGDRLFGNGGNDVLIGGVNSGFSPAFRDEMTGGTGADRFVFSSSLDSSSAASMDIIHDFNHGEGDKIDLRGIDADMSKRGNQAFTFIGTNEITKRGQLQIQDSGDGGFFVKGNVIGNASFDFVIKVEDVASLVKGDFLL